MSLVQGFIKPMDSLYFPYSKAVVGHTIPGVLQRYPVRTVNYSDLSSALHRQRPTEDPVKKFPGMNEEHGTGSSMMDRLKAILNGKQPAEHQFESLKEGYERLREDLGWRGRGYGRRTEPAPLAGFPPAAGLMAGVMPGAPPMPGAGAPPLNLG